MLLITFIHLFQQYEFETVEIPDLQEGKVELSTKLQKYGISLTQYERAISQKEIKR